MRNAEDTPASGFARAADAPGDSGTPRPGTPLPRRRPGENRPDWTAPGEAEALADAEALRYAARADGAPWGPAPEPPPPAAPGYGEPTRSRRRGPGPAPVRSEESAPRRRGPGPLRSVRKNQRPAGGDQAPLRSVRVNQDLAARGQAPPRPVRAAPAVRGCGPRPRSPAVPRPARPPLLRPPHWPRSPTWWRWPARWVALCGPGADHTPSATAPGWSVEGCSPPPSPGSSCRRAQWDCSPAGGGSLMCWHSASSVPGCWCLHSCCRRLDQGGQLRGRRTSPGAWPADEGNDQACPRSRWRIRSSSSTATR